MLTTYNEHYSNPQLVMRDKVWREKEVRWSQVKKKFWFEDGESTIIGF